MSFIIGANSAVAGGFAVDNSCRFNSTSSDKLTRTFGSGGSVVKWTYSTWFKISYIGGNEQVFFSSLDNGDNYSYIKINGNNKLEFRAEASGSDVLRYTLTRRFRDPSAFMHLVVALDSSLGTAGDRIKIWINGVRETVFDASTAPSQDAITLINSAAAHEIGHAGDGSDFFNGYMSQVGFINNAQYDADQFGEFDEDSGIWKPIDISGLTFGQTSFFLDFADSADLGDDESGNSNDWTEVNLAATDQATDTPTNNFATLNPLNYTSTAIPYSEGNTYGTFPGAWMASLPTIGLTNGKWFWEAKLNSGNDANMFYGVAREGIDLDTSPQNQTGVIVQKNDGDRYVDGSYSAGAAESIASGNTLGVALDLDSGTKTIKFYKNGTLLSSGSSINLTSNFDGYTLFPIFIGNSSSATAEWQTNFGNPAYAISSGNADGNGYGNFEYAVPSGYFALCTKNLAEHG